MMKSVVGATVVALSILQLALSSEYSKVNGSVSVPAGTTVSSASTVNGSVEVGEKAHLGSASTVNGAIRVGAGAQVSGDVEAVNGKLSIAAGAVVGGGLSNVNGVIDIEKAQIKGSITTYNGDLTIGAGARVDGGIRYKKSTMNWTLGRAPRVVIGPDAVVVGSLIFERPVQLFVSATAKVGQVTGAQATRFTGATPPG